MSWISDLKETYEVYKERDPAIRTYWDVLLYPCYKAMRMYRRAHRLWLSGHTWTARWLSQRAARKTGIEIHPGATIGKGFFIDHGTGVVIGETCEIGGKEQGKRHPTLEDGVMVSAGAKVLGSITIGKNSKIGAGAVVIKSVPENCTVVGVPGRIVRMKNQIVPRDDINQTNLPDPILMDMKVLERANNELINRMISLEAEVKALKAGKTADATPLEEEKARESFHLKPDERDFVEVDDCIFGDNI